MFVFVIEVFGYFYRYNSVGKKIDLTNNNDQIVNGIGVTITCPEA